MVTAGIAGAVVVALSLYIVAMDWIPFPRWNPGISRDEVGPRLASSLWHAGVGAFVAASNFAGRASAMLVGAVWYSILLVVELRGWWLPVWHRFGDRAARARAGLNAAVASRPSLVRGRSLAPDLQHAVMETLMAVSAAVCWIAFIARP